MMENQEVESDFLYSSLVKNIKISIYVFIA